jgi:hypothetical protein
MGDKMELHGVTGAPYKHPTVRRAIPAPFARPSINATGGKKIKRTWKDTAVIDLEQGDTVAGFGTVESSVEFINTESDVPWRVRIYNVMGDYRDFVGNDRVFSFSGAPDE